MEVLPDGTLAATTYGHWAESQQPCIVSVGLTLAELDAQAKAKLEKAARGHRPRTPGPRSSP